jgi:transcriptional regulator with GAF, ATPase, and Fis domain
VDTLETNGAASAIPHVDAARLGLVILFAADAPELCGAWLPLGGAGETMVLGRGGRDGKDKYPRVLPVRQRPGVNEATPPLNDPFLSSEQLQLTVSDATTITILNVGKRELLDSTGTACTTLKLTRGDIAQVRGRLLLLACERPSELPPARSLAKKFHLFGEADVDGLVGESAAAWRLRDATAFIGARPAHVLLLGESGTGKEIVANTIHRISSRRGRSLVSRNAATLPSGLIDAELVGHVADYPNAGMPERPGLIAEADGSTLFLDEIGELGPDLSTKLLRVLDEKGEYQRLGDSRMRSSKFRFIGATNRSLADLKEDLVARFRLRLIIPPLAERREDIPLLARHLLRRAALQDPAIGERFFEGWNAGRASGEPRIAIDLMKSLVLHRYRTHIRELDALLWASLGSSPASIAELTPEVLASLSSTSASTVEREEAEEEGETGGDRVDIQTLTADDVRLALERAGGVHEKAWRDLRLGNRHVLKRLMKKFGLA